VFRALRGQRSVSSGHQEGLNFPLTKRAELLDKDTVHHELLVQRSLNRRLVEHFLGKESGRQENY
jgi:hypothetical protein